MGEGFLLGSKDQLRLDIVHRIINGKLSRNEGRRLLNVSERTMGRYISGYEKHGIASIRHGNGRKEPVNKIAGKMRIRLSPN